MRRFELLTVKPVRFRELGVEGSELRIREGTRGTKARELDESCDSADEATARAETLIAAWRAEGFVEIKRLAPAKVEDSVRRDERLEWRDGYVARWRTLVQYDKWVRSIHGHYDNHDQRKEIRDAAPTEKRFETIAAASAQYDAWRTEAEHEMALAKERPRERPRRKATRPVASDPALEAQCRATPDDPTPWQVYADWLMSRGDPRGEIAGLALGGKSTDARGAITTHFADIADHIRYELVWGFVRGVTIRRVDDTDELADLVERVLASPLCAFVESIACGLTSDDRETNDWGPTLAAIGAAPQARVLRELRFDAWDSGDSELSWVPFGDLSAGWTALPALETLVIKAGGGGTLGTLALPTLRHFTRISGGLSNAEVEAICRATWPQLVSLEIWTGHRDYGADVRLADLQPILDGRGLPRLGHLGIVNSELVDELLAALPRSRILPQLYSLDLSMGIAAATAAHTLVERAPAYRHLAALDLSENLLLEPELEQIRGVLDNVVAIEQRERDEDFPGDPAERYVAVGE